MKNLKFRVIGCFLLAGPLASSVSAQALSVSPSLVFEGQSFKTSMVISPDCNEGVSSITKTTQESNVRYEIDLVGDRLENCSDFSPPIKGVVTYRSDIVSGLSQGINYIDMEYYIDSSTGRKSIGSERVELNVRSIDQFQGAGGLKYNFESPKPGTTVSGVNLIRGWACYESPVAVSSVEYQIDDGARIEIPFGSTRPDTSEVCDGNSNSGFGAVINWSVYSLGQHAIKLFVNGSMVEESEFNISGLGQEFVRGLSGSFTLADFPESGKTSTIEWSEASQNFIIKQVN